MNQKSNNKSKILLSIILIILVILCALYVQFNNQDVNNKYSNIDINSEKLNIFYFDQTTTNMIQGLKGIFARKPLISIGI